MRAASKFVALLMLSVLPVSEASARVPCFVVQAWFRPDTKAQKYWFLADWPEAITGLQGQQTTVKQCIIDGLMLWDGKSGVTIRPANGVGDSTVDINKSGPFDRVRGTWIPVQWRTYLPWLRVLKTGAIHFNDDIGFRSGWRCDRIMKVAAHEMGHQLGFPDDNGFPSGATMMRQVERESILDDLDALPLGPTCGDVEALRFIGEVYGPEGPSGEGPIAGCSLGSFSDDSGCCHPETPLLLEASGWNRKPIVHITSPSATGLSLTAPASFSAVAHGFDLDGSISRMDWRIDGVVVRSQIVGQNGPPYQPWSANISIAAGRTTPYVLDVVAYDYVSYTISAPILVNVSGPPPATSVLASGEILYANQYKTSPNGAYYLIYQTDGNLVLYGPAGAILATMTFGTPGGTYMNPDGNVQVFNAGPVLVWQSGTSGNPGAQLRVLDSGRVALVRPDGTVVVQWP